MKPGRIDVACRARSLLFSTVALLLAVNARAAALMCTFADEQGRVLRSVEVQLTLIGTELSQHEKSDKKGQVVFKNLSPGTYGLHAQLKDHVPLSRNVEVANDQTFSLTLMTRKGFDHLELEADHAINTGEFSKAAGILENLVAAYPLDPVLHDNLGRAYAGMLDEEKALAEARKAAQLDPRFSGSQMEIERFILRQQGQKALESRDFAKAAGLFERLAKLDPKNAEAYYGMALAYGHQQDYTKALPAIRKAIELDPQNDAYLKVKGILEANAHAQ